ncbi:hypothetical protein ACJMK2_008963 [Sinanodonta woodiana]|uniref:Uncharacterized protein n=1 Tax=Sinanodonta woodiana TaxID=1069815 RepID=A0ABD3VAU4_SINWO
MKHPEAFKLLSDSVPTMNNIDEVLTYFEHTYIRGRRIRDRGEHYRPVLLPAETWNQMLAIADDAARTNSICDGWHYSLQSLLQCTHTTMWRLLDCLHMDCTKKTTFLHAVVLANHPAENRYRILHERVQRAVKTYGQTDVLTYLRAIAHLSFS